MELTAAQQLAINKMNEYGLLFQGWRFQWFPRRSVKWLGKCKWNAKRILLNPEYVRLNEESEVLDIILHEIAHALVPGGHTPQWKRKCMEIGATPKRLASNVVLPPRPPRSIIGTCPNGHTYHRYRMPRVQTSCSVCCKTFNTEYLITFKRIA